MSETETPLAPAGATSRQFTAGSGVDERPTGRRRSDRIVGASENTQRVVEQVSSSARSDQPVLVVGPTGSGKQHVARALHAWSGRAAGPLLAFSVGAIADGQQREELFGTSNASRPLLNGGTAGAIEAATGGTIVVHRIDLLSDSVRAELTNAMRDGTLRRVGQTGGEAIPLRARVIATAETGGTGLLADLATHVIELMPLVGRDEDILPLSAHFLAEGAQELGVEPVGFTADARRLIVEEPWLGNVRELRERIRTAIQLAGQGAISAEALMLSTQGDEVPSFKEAKRAFETRYVEGLLRRCSGNISRAARLAKKDRKDFYDVIRRTGVDPSEFRS
jgi:two-component system response regulator GlrR